jgi:hypothetical protein
MAGFSNAFPVMPDLKSVAAGPAPSASEIVRYSFDHDRLYGRQD